LLLSGLLEGLLSLNRKLGDLFSEPIIGDHTDHIRHSVFFQEAIERRDGEAGVGAQQDVSPRIGLLQLFDQPLQDRYGGL